MNKRATKPNAARRRYESPVREAKAAETRERILVAGSQLAHESSQWDISNLTVRAIAERAGVSERTVYRHFDSEQGLHEAMMRQLEDEAGVKYEGLELDDLPDLVERMFTSLATFSVKHWGNRDGTASDTDHRRRQAMLQSIVPITASWSEEERNLAAGIFDLLWTPPAYERLVNDWKLDNAGATQAVSWAIEMLIKAINEGHKPKAT